MRCKAAMVIARFATEKSLTEEEKFAMCFCAGVPIKTEMEGGKMIIVTATPCAVIHDGRQWRVFTRE